MSVDNPEEIILSNFKLKPKGTGATRNTLVENDSLSSYSLPDETPSQNAAGSGRQSDDQADERATRDLKGKGIPLGFNDAIINIEDSKKQDTSYVEAYMKFMYLTCISPFDPSSNTRNVDACSWLQKALHLTQKGCFAVTTTMALLQAFFYAKYYILLNFASGDLENFISMAFYIMSASTQVYYIYMFTVLQHKLRRMLKFHQDLRAFRNRTSTKPIMTNNAMKYAVCLGSVSLLVSLLETIWVGGTEDWTPGATFEYHCSETAEGLYLWTSKNVKNFTLTNEIAKQCENEVRISPTILGGFGALIYFFTNAQMEAIENLILMDAETLKEEIKIVERKINTPAADENNLTLVGFLRDDGEWRHIKLIMQVTKKNNETFDPLMKYKHVDNLMLFVYFMLKAFDGDLSLFLTFCVLFSVVKTSYMYRIATEASTLNDNAIEWIRRVAWKTVDKSFLDRVSLVFNELEKNPIGMGKGQFMINENFLFRFLGSIGSLFVLQAQSGDGTSE